MIEAYVIGMVVLFAIPAYAYVVVRAASCGYFQSKREFTRTLFNELENKGEVKCP